MALVNKLQKIVDAPVFEWMRPAPVATAALSGLCASDDLGARYLYYITGSSFFRYDAWSDSWQTLASPNVAPLTALSIKYSKYSGYRGQAIAGGASTITLAGLRGNVLVGQTIRIVGGTGAGQERTITSITDTTIGDFGVVTAASSASISDSVAHKKWRINQWEGYQCRLVYSTGQTQVRKILYNDATTLYFNDVNYQHIDSFNNTGFSAVAPYALPITTAGSQTHYVIESSVATVGVAWTVVPDNTSKYQLVSGGIFLFSSAAATPFSTFQWYDILSDTWYTKTAVAGHLTAAVGTDYAIERTGEVGGTFATGTSSGAGTIRTLVNSGAGMTQDRFSNYQIRITGGTGIGQRRRIVGNNTTTFWVDRSWEINPDATSTYSVYADTDKIWLMGNASSALFQYSVEADLWASGSISDSGIARGAAAAPYGVSATGVPPEEPLALTSITRATGGVLTVGVNAGGTGHALGDLITCGTAKVYVTSLSSPGVVGSVAIAHAGSGFTAAGTAAQTATNGAGTGFILTTTTVGVVGLVTTAINHHFQPGQNITISGITGDVTWNGNFVITGTDSLTTFSVAAPATSANGTVTAQATTGLMDSTAAWITNEHAGKLLVVFGAGPAPATTQIRRITSNTSNTIVTTTAITAPVNGTSRYLIQGIQGFGAFQTNKIPTRGNSGWASAGSTTSLTDSTKDWTPNQYVNCRVRVMSGTGVGNEAVITSNTATVLNVASWPNATPDTTSKYLILDACGIQSSVTLNTITDANKNWTLNNLAGKRFRIIAGTALGTEGTVTSNAVGGGNIVINTATPGVDSCYVIYDPPARSTGTSLNWAFGLTNATNKGKWLLSSRGGASNAFDIYDITTNRWDITPYFDTQSETLTTGSMYSYDGTDTVYFTKDATGRIFALNLNNFSIDACTTTPYVQGTAIIGNRFEVVSTADGLQYLYIMRHSGQEFWRTLKFW